MVDSRVGAEDSDPTCMSMALEYTCMLAVIHS
jgi:hypothetical protein